MASASLSSAASLAVSNVFELNFVDYLDTPLGAGYVAKIGFTDAVLTTTDTFSSILAGWSQGGDIAFPYAPGYDGYFSGNAVFTDAAGLAGKLVNIWVTDGGDNNFVMQHNLQTFKFDAEIPNSDTMDIRNSSIGSFTIKLGTLDPTGTNAAGDTGSLVLNNVPEPSAALLGAIGVLGLLRRRRN